MPGRVKKRKMVSSFCRSVGRVDILLLRRQEYRKNPGPFRPEAEQNEKSDQQTQIAQEKRRTVGRCRMAKNLAVRDRRNFCSDGNRHSFLRADWPGMSAESHLVQTVRLGRSGRDAAFPRTRATAARAYPVQLFRLSRAYWLTPRRGNPKRMAKSHEQKGIKQSLAHDFLMLLKN